MPRNVSELKSVGGGNLYAVPPEKWKVGDASPSPPPIDARAEMSLINN